MVYCGRPSKACESCRARRIKCDFRRPSCTQCTKISKTCPGYRDQLDLAFRDESATVVRKAQTRRKSSRSPEPKTQTSSRKSSPSSSQEGTESSSDSDSPPSESELIPLNMTPSLPIEDFATIYFMDTYISGSHFDYLPAVYGASSPGSPLFAAVNANACANLYRETGEREMLVTAQRHYIDALKQTNAAISSPSRAKLDSTIASILLLGLYETLTLGRKKSTESFLAHNNGAAALLRLRGQEQFGTVVGRRIYSQISLNMRVSCIDRNVELPADLLAVDEIANVQTVEGLFLKNTLRFTDEVNELRMAAKLETQRGNLSTATIESALILDGKLAVAVEKYCTFFKIEMVQLDHDDPTVLGRSYRKFPSHRVAQGYNALNMLRIVCQEHVWEQMELISGGDTKKPASNADKTGYLLQRIALRSTEEMARNICSTIPQFCRRELNGLVAATPAMFLLWPLAVAGHCLHAPPDVKAYTIDRLRYFGTEARLEQGLWAAQAIEENGPMSDWLHITHCA